MKFKHLLKTTALTLLLIIAGKVGWGQAILTETFSYATPAYIGGNGAVGTSSNGWTTHSITTGQTTTVDINDVSLSYTGLVASTGNKVYLFSNANATSRDINTAFTSTATTLYFSALANIVDNSQINTTGDYFMSFGASSGSSAGSLGGRLGAKSVNGGLNFRFVIQNTSGGTPTWTDNGSDLSFGTTYLVVVKYDRTAIPTAATMWVNPATLGSTEPAGSVSNNSGTSTVTTLGSVCLRNSATTPKVEIDEIRVGTTFADVTPVPDVTPPTLSSTTPADEATGIALNLSSLSLTFSEDIAKGTGNIVVKKVSDDSVIETIDVTTGAVAISNSTATVTLTSTLAFNTDYYINIDATAIKDLANNNFAGISDKTTWNFTSRLASTAATVTSADYTVTDGPTWTISNIPSSVSVATFEGKLTPAAGATIATFEADGTTPATGTVLNGYKLKVTAENGTTTNTYSLVVTPALSAATSNNDVDHSFDITFTDDAAWRAAITAVKDDATTLTLTTDYTIASGTLTLIPASTNSLKVSGSRTITVVATGYADATVTQIIKPGVFTHATISNAPAMGLGVTSTVTLTAKDQFENLVSGYIFKYDVTITNTTVTTAESYTIDGIARTASISDIPVTATNASGVATFDIAVPGVVDGDDGISVQVQLNDGTTNLGSALSYIAPTAPTAVISPTTISEHSLEGAVVNITLQNATFVGTFDKANFTINAPAGLSVASVASVDATHANLTLTYDDANNDFDSDFTTFNVKILAAELSSAVDLTSNDITLTATVEVAPTVTTDASIASNGVTTATWGGNVSATGGEAVTVKGLCWGLTTLPTTANNITTEAAGTGTITGSMTGLLPNTLYYVRAYATNSVGTEYGVEKSFTTYSDEPTNQVNTFAVTPNGTDLVISWVNNNGAVVPTHYLIKASTTNNVTDPVDFTTVPSDQLVIGDNNGVKVCLASETSFTWTGLPASTPYYFKIYALAKNVDNIPNYNTTSAPAANATTNSAAKDITATTIGTLDAANKKITGIPSTTTVTALKAAITVSANATFDVLVATGGAPATGTSTVTNTMVIKVTAQNLTSQEYTITTVIATTIVDNLAALIALPANTPVKYTGKATITYMRTSRNQKYIQDATGAVLIDDPTTAPGFITGTYAVGDGITNIEGKIVLYYGLVELTPTVQTGATCTGNPVITPEVKTLANLTTADQSKLVKVENFTFTNPATEGDASGNFAASKNYTISDGVARDTICQFRTAFSEANYITTAIPTTPKSANVLVVMYKKNNFSKVVMQIVARNLADFLSTGIDDNLNSSLSIYPNPFSNEIRFEGSQSIKRVVITSITGQVLKNVEIGQVNFVNTQDLPRGMYLVTFMNSKGEKTTQKMVKQ
ncbi:MAG: T9SS type A sorting domain-containing protein [Bacteroidales bacterium]|nr:T9SS type A sorting domain-containing protein [Bacteroidales bacterium]